MSKNRITNIEPATGDKKWVATFADGTKTRFGAAGANDYTITGDEKARAAYRARHERDLRTKDPQRAGYLSYYILWGDSTSIKKNVADFNKRFG
jgi:hypothetical protein